MPSPAMNGNERLTLSTLQSRSNDVSFALKFVFYAALLWLGGELVMSAALWKEVTGVILLGAIFAHGVELQHQVRHAQGFRNGYLNDMVGVVLGLPMLVSYADYKSSHLHHHKYLGTPENREFFDYGDQYGSLTLRSVSGLITRLFMFQHYFRFVKNVAIVFSRRQYPNSSPNVSKQIVRDYLVMLSMIIIFAVITYFFGWKPVLMLWILPMSLIAAPVHALIEMPEHFRCDLESTDCFANTRTIKSNAFMNWFTNGNNYHVEHHLMPGLPIDRLYELHAKIHSRYKYYNVSYREFYFNLLHFRARGE